VEQAAAASWSLPAGHYTLNYLTGRWAGEWNLTQEKLQPRAVIESRRGSTGHQANPWFAIQSGEASEEQARSGSARWPGAFLAHHHRAGPVGDGARHRRLQSLRLRLRTALRRAAGDAGLYGGYARTGWARHRGCCIASSWSTFCREPRPRPAALPKPRP